MGRGRGITTVVALAGSLAAPALWAEAANIRLRSAAMRGSVARIVADAIERLRQPACAAVLDEFEDASGHTLRANLDAVGMTAPEYLDRILFYDGLEHGRCRTRGILAVTRSGDRVVFVCSRFFEQAGHDPELASFIVIHEALHTLGLGEDPPSSREITARVLKRCR